MLELVTRFMIGGAVVSIFAMLGEMLRPKSLAGLLGAAPSIALATIGMTIRHEGPKFAALEARSMILGAIAFCFYAAIVGWVLRRFKPSTLLTALALMPVWFGVSFGGALLIGRNSWQ